MLLCYYVACAYYLCFATTERGPGYAYRMAGAPASELTPPSEEAVFRRSLDGGVSML